VLGALGAQAVGEGKRALELAQVREARERGHLADDRVGLRSGDRVEHGGAVEAVEDDGLGAEGA
jgi:hypothetical protein